MSTVKATNFQNASSATANMVTDASGNVSFGGTAAMSSSFLRNRIINGDMRIDQRNAGASVTPTSGQYLVDRFYYQATQTSKATAQQNAGAVTPPSGFTNYQGITSSSAYSVISSDYFLIRQAIEGYNVSDLAWGTANAATVTLSFWVRSSLTGTFGGAFTNTTGTRWYPFSYTISVANTWEQKTITVAGDTSGTWTMGNSAGIQISFNLGAGTTYSGTAGAWTGSTILAPTGAVSVVGTSGATWYVTGVQLEVGTVATPFERQIYNAQLAQCQRYYWKIIPANGVRFSLGYVTTTTTISAIIQYPVEMRAAPSALEQTGTAANYLIAYAATAQACSSVPTFVSASVNSSTYSFTVPSGLTVGQGGQAGSNATGAYLAWSSEL